MNNAMNASRAADVPVQIPGSVVAQYIGEKLMISANLLVQTAGCFLLPSLGRASAAPGGSTTPLALCLGLMGLFQVCAAPSILHRCATSAASLTPAAVPACRSGTPS